MISLVEGENVFQINLCKSFVFTCIYSSIFPAIPLYSCVEITNTTVAYLDFGFKCGGKGPHPIVMS